MSHESHVISAQPAGYPSDRRSLTHLPMSLFYNGMLAEWKGGIAYGSEIGRIANDAIDHATFPKEQKEIALG